MAIRVPGCTASTAHRSPLPRAVPAPRRISRSRPSSARRALFGWIELSELAFVYFASTLATLAFGLAIERTAESLALLAGLSFLGLPLAYPLVLPREETIGRSDAPHPWIRWILGLEIAVGVWSWHGGWLATPSAAMVAFFSTALTGFAYLRVRDREHAATSRRARNARGRLAALQGDDRSFRAILEGGPRVDSSPLPGDLILGESHGEADVLALLAPHCPRCAQCFLDLRRLAHAVPDRFRIRIRLLVEATPVNVAEDLVAFVVRQPENAEDFLADWYSHLLRRFDAGDIGGSAQTTLKMYRSWLLDSSGQLLIKNCRTRSCLIRQARWERENSVTGSPALIVNGLAWSAFHDLWRHLLSFAPMLSQFEEPLSTPVDSGHGSRGFGL